MFVVVLGIDTYFEKKILELLDEIIDEVTFKI